MDVAQPTGKLEAAFSASGTMMVLVRWDGEPSQADLYLSTWDGRVWTRPVPVTSVNSEADERAPEFSHDGKLLYFSSTREGGQGGLATQLEPAREQAAVGLPQAEPPEYHL